MLHEYQSENIIITDTNCFILLDKIEALFILNALYSNIVTTPQIATEFGKALPPWITIKPVSDQSLLKKYSEKVDIGEASAIALAMEIDNPLLIIDDLKGRKLASQLELSYTGTIGVMILAKQKGLINSLRQYFEKIKETDFRISPELLERILKDIGE
jgi:predicted nucleic acid-binding protein